MTTVNGWKPLTIFSKSPLLNVGGFLDLPVELTNFANFVYFFVIYKVGLYYIYYSYTYEYFLYKYLVSLS